ncbi:Methyltransferase domain [Candidatus Nitrososphaera evergladensis SR1]|jgi:2-polyprenyl-3-methyl-5-hydroxy-6-metoxy-1,4-benzoquinol methylase|uniref:Methyltransferase domain n=1 Tax=Candidatus Nitrososphaera evergladensis SR1 TaxID=1459636 RepID=A0A075MW78_9ARCH|nr:class I SAM-dependent methyltransferase [Candidatus Nitrososphaera evergladensis]AIF84897.1 Methyltransferase domain [Candidatus Nitrososphaera evergladensis SR1]
MVDEAKLNEFIGKVVSDMGGGAGVLLAFVGDRLGLYRAMAGAGSITADALAQKTGTNPRMIREWLASQAAGGYVSYDAKTGEYMLPEEQAMALAQEGGPAFMQGGFQILVSLFKDEQKIIEAVRTGRGLSWGDHDKCLFEGTERFFRPAYNANLIRNWIPALDGVEAKLVKGAKMADVGCGHGASTILLAKAYPNSKFYGFDYHEPSIEWAKKQAEKEGVADRVTFQVAKSTDFAGDDYDVVAFFDCLHDMADPYGAAAHTYRALKKKDGTMFIVEPYAEDRLEDNLNPLGRLFYSASTTVCVPASLAQGGPGLGAQAGEKRIREVVEKGGFTRFRRAMKSPVNLVYEARP